MALEPYKHGANRRVPALTKSGAAGLTIGYDIGAVGRRLHSCGFMSVQLLSQSWNKLGIVGIETPVYTAGG